MNGAPLRPWLAAIPGSWSVQRIKHVVRFAGGGTPSKAVDEYWGGDIPWVSPKDMKVFRILESQDYITEAAVASSACSLIPIGATLMVVRSGILQHTIPVAINDVQVCLNQDMKALIPEEGMVSEYLAYLIQGLNDRLLDEWVKQGATVESIEYESMANTPIPVPPLEQQLTIATYLDAETARIDGLIQAKEKLLSLIAELRVTAIYSAVTRGIDEGAAYRDCGRSWFKSIPSHWDAPALRLIAQLESGHTPSRSVAEYWTNCYIPWMSLGDVWQIRSGRQRWVEKTSETISDLGLANSSARLLPAGTVILSRTASVGFSGIMKVPMATTQDFVNWVCGPSIEPEYLWYALQAMKPEFDRLKFGSTHQTIYMPDVERFVVPRPPIDEQRAIVRHLDAELKTVDDLADHVGTEINLLRAMRAATITDAVLGRIDVREHMKN